MENAELKALIISKLTEKMKDENGNRDGKFDWKVKVYVREGTKQVPKYKDVTDATEYFDYWYNRLKASMPRLNEYGILTMMAKDPRVGISLYEYAVSVPDNEIMTIDSITNGMTNITIKAQVMASTYQNGISAGKGNAYEKLWMLLQDKTGKVSCTIFKNAEREMFDPFFIAYHNQTLNGKAVMITKGAFGSKDPRYKPSLSIPTGGAITIIDETLDIRSEVIAITDLNEAMNDKNITIEGKISNIVPMTLKTGTRKGIFIISGKNGEMIAGQCWKDTVDEIPPEGTIVQASGLLVWRDEYRSSLGYDPKLLTVFGGGFNVVTDADPAAYPDVVAQSSGRIINSLIDAKDGDTFEGYGYLYGFKSTQYDLILEGQVPKPIYYLECTRNHEGLQRPPRVSEREDGTLKCWKCGPDVIIPVTETNHRLQFNATMSDGFVPLPTTIFGETVVEMFGLTEAELLAEYDQVGHDAFFNARNDIVPSCVFKIKGRVSVKAFGPIGVQFNLISVKRCDIEEAINFELGKLQPIESSN